jgi:hypothetical protein
MVAFVFLSAAGANAATIDYAPISNGTGEEYWGPGAGILGQSYGQIFTAPEAVLQSYSLILSYKSNSTFPFVSQIYQYGTTVVGPALYTSDVTFTTDTLATYTFFPDITLIAGGRYIAIVTNEPNGVSLGGNDPIFGGLGFALGTDTVTTGFNYALGDPSIGADWECQGALGCLGTPLAFHAEFSDPASLPAALPLFATGLGALSLLGWRRKRTAVGF